MAKHKRTVLPFKEVDEMGWGLGVEEQMEDFDEQSAVFGERFLSRVLMTETARGGVSSGTRGPVNSPAKAAGCVPLPSERAWR